MLPRRRRSAVCRQAGRLVLLRPLSLSLPLGRRLLLWLLLRRQARRLAAPLLPSWQLIPLCYWQRRRLLLCSSLLLLWFPWLRRTAALLPCWQLIALCLGLSRRLPVHVLPLLLWWR